MIDSHAHLDNPRYDEDRDAMLARAYKAGVRTILSIGIGENPDSMHEALGIARAYAGKPGVPKIYATAGIYPHETHVAGDDAYTRLESLLEQPEVLACGEIGLDYYHDGSPHEVQKQAFSRQMEIAASRKKPIIIHCRPSDSSNQCWDDTLAMLASEWKSTGLGGILHCFAGEWKHAKQAMDLGFLISFTGNITYPKAQPIRDVLVQVPLDQILIETDAPFLAPVPYRGKRNEPAFVAEVAAKLGEVKNISAKEAALATTQNFHRFFGTENAS